MIERIWFTLRVVVYWLVVITAASFGRMAAFGLDQPVFSQMDEFAHASTWILPLVYFLAAAIISLPALVACIAIALIVGPARLMRYPIALVVVPPAVCVLGYVLAMLLEATIDAERVGALVDPIIMLEVAGYGLACTVLGVVCERWIARRGWGLGLYAPERRAER